MISVIITTYNRPEKLKKAIQSVIDQTFTDWELIIVDDHSRQQLDSVSQFNDARILYMSRETNSGKQSVPKNEGTMLAKGEYIAYLDDDNTFRPDHLQVLYNAITRDPTLDLVYGDRMFNDEQGVIPSQIGIFSDYNPQTLLQHNYIDASDFLVKKQSLIDIGGWDERYKRMADWNLVIRLAKNGARMKRVPVIITDYYLGSDSMSHTPESKDKVILWNPYELEVCLPYLQPVKEPKVAVFTVMHSDDQLPIAQKCLPELWKRAGYKYFHLVILNGDLPKTREWLKTNKVDEVIENKENLGIAGACNQATDYFRDKDFDVIWKVDSDMLVETDDILKVMVDLYKKNHMMIWSAYPEGLIDSAGGVPRIGYGTLGGHLIGMVQHIGGFCQFVPAKLRFSFRFPDTKVLHFMEDLFLSQQAAKHGYGLAYIEDLRVRHTLKV